METVSGFGTAVKLGQTHFRNTSPSISVKGRTPYDDVGRRNSHLLALGCEEENLYPGIRGSGGAVDFFRERRIKWWKTSRSGDDTNRIGPTRNMTSSQVACVNFLLPLIGIPGALLSAIRSIDSDVRGIVDIIHEDHSTPVEFEWIGGSRSLEGGRTRGAQNTSIDAFVIAETVEGRLRAYLFEWKYAEHYLRTRPNFKGKGQRGERRRMRYTGLYNSELSSFNLEVAPDMDDFLYEPFYQIMRQRLLADRMVQHRELDVAEAKVVIVVPEQNWAYRSLGAVGWTTSPPLAARFPHLRTVESVMRAVLRNPDEHFDMVSPATMLEAVCQDHTEETRTWADYWRRRYAV